MSRFRPRETLSAKRTGGGQIVFPVQQFTWRFQAARDRKNAPAREREQLQLLDPALLNSSTERSLWIGGVRGAKPRRAAVCTRRGVPGLVKGWSRQWHGATDGEEAQGTSIEKNRYSAREKLCLGEGVGEAVCKRENALERSFGAVLPGDVKLMRWASATTQNRQTSPMRFLCQFRCCGPETMPVWGRPHTLGRAFVKPLLRTPDQTPKECNASQLGPRYPMNHVSTAASPTLPITTSRVPGFLLYSRVE